jgi:hypothetical protein
MFKIMLGAIFIASALLFVLMNKKPVISSTKLPDEILFKTFETENTCCLLFDKEILALDNLGKKDWNFPKSPSDGHQQQENHHDHPRQVGRGKGRKSKLLSSYTVSR